ncbi:HNH endonuclease [Bacteroides sp. An322]|uniref:HNH endonuclease n=1 Tax=Bacteroides sp. An322 TaxID=1965632 RepID=UPI000B38245A|nr:HNH endonuclease [Bacteroides sp. An322]OUO24034.1 hypothetical protein B5F91_00025 [Bacteroides sp. An322]
MGTNYEKYFWNIQSDFYHYMITYGGITPKTSSDYVTRLKYLSSFYRIDETLTEEDIEYILQQENTRRLQRTKYTTPKAITDFKSGLRKFLNFLKSDYRKQYENSILYEIENININKKLTTTEKEALIQSRIGQGIFRKSLIKFWQGCAISHCSMTDILVASHIKPWKDATNHERLDIFNGLLLLPNYDKLFDLGYMTFTPQKGKAVYSKLLSSEDRHILGLTDSLSLSQITKEHKTYLTYHNEYCFMG